MSEQLRSEEDLAFKVNSDRLVLKTCSDHELGKDAANMLNDKEMKSKQQAFIQIEVNGLKSQKDVIKYKLFKLKLSALCNKNRDKHRYHTPFLSLRLRNDMIGSRNKINFLSFAG